MMFADIFFSIPRVVFSFFGHFFCCARFCFLLFLNPPANHFHFINVCRPFTLRVIIVMFGLKSAVLSFVFFLFSLFLLSLFLLSYFHLGYLTTFDMSSWLIYSVLEHNGFYSFCSGCCRYYYIHKYLSWFTDNNTSQVRIKWQNLTSI